MVTSSGPTDEDHAYWRLTGRAVSHFCEKVQPALDEWAQGARKRWDAELQDEQTSHDGAGFSLWQHSDFREFQGVFEEQMAEFLEAENCTMETFRTVLQRAQTESDAGVESLGSLFLMALSAIDDFEAFTFFMKSTLESPRRAESDQETTCKDDDRDSEGKQDDIFYK